MNKVIMGLCLALFMACITHAHADEIRVKIPIHQFMAGTDQEGYTIFSGAKMRFVNQPGEPALPSQSVRVLLPPDAEPASLKATLSGVKTRQLPGTWNVRPMPALSVSGGREGRAYWPGNRQIVNGRDRAVYGRNRFFPASRLCKVTTGNKRKWRLAEVLLAPYQYNPVTKRLVSLEQAVLTVTFTRNPARLTPSDINDTLADKLVKDTVINYGEVAPTYDVMSDGPAPSDGEGGYAVITTDAIVNGSTLLADLIAAKEQRGYQVYVATEGDWGGGAGDAAADNIRAWLTANYAALNLQYVLLIGNPAPDSGDVPMKMLWPLHNAEWSPWKESPSDFYYADLTGNWDLDGDGYSGEWGDDFGPGGVDRYWEVLVGRVPCYENLADLDSILAKLIAYQNETEQDISWRGNVLLPVNPPDDTHPGYQLGEAIKDDIVVPKSWGFHRVYDGDYGLTPVPETIPCTIDDVTAAWTGDDFGAVFWWTHGNATLAGDVMDTAHAALLDDTHPVFTFQGSCENAYPEASDNLAYSLLKNGAVSTVGATRVSWQWTDQTTFPGTVATPGMVYEYALRLVTDESSSAMALYDLKEDIDPGGDALWMNYTDFNVYGDPELSLFSHTVAVDPCECDLNDDGRCDMRDWLLFGVRWGATDCNTMPCACDLNADGRCDMRDWLIFGQDWGRTDCPIP